MSGTNQTLWKAKSGDSPSTGIKSSLAVFDCNLPGKLVSTTGKQVLSTMSRARRKSLSVAQLEIAAQFADHSFDYPHLTFEQVAKKFLGPRPFPATPTGRKFRAEAKAVFDQEREK